MQPIGSYPQQMLQSKSNAFGNNASSPKYPMPEMLILLNFFNPIRLSILREKTASREEAHALEACMSLLNRLAVDSDRRAIEHTRS
jgi:hypothetical protein